MSSADCPREEAVNYIKTFGKTTLSLCFLTELVHQKAVHRCVEEYSIQNRQSKFITWNLIGIMILLSAKSVELHLCITSLLSPHFNRELFT